MQQRAKLWQAEVDWIAQLRERLLNVPGSA
jgi:hypothetical protein